VGAAVDTLTPHKSNTRATTVIAVDKREREREREGEGRGRERRGKRDSEEKR
jgi:hypothetical protein